MPNSQNPASRLPSFMEDYDPNAMSVAKAKLFIQAHLSPLTACELVPIKEGLGRVLAQAVLSPAQVPNYDNSAMDGYAFNSLDIADQGQTSLSLIGTAYAGKGFHQPVQKGQCVRIMTGAMMPSGTDSVVVQEKVSLAADSISFSKPANSKMNVRYAGEDLSLGQTVLAAGHLIQAADLGLLASLGIAQISVYRKLKVAFFSTGDELAGIGQPLKIGQVYDSNRYTLYGMLSRLGLDILDFGAIADDPDLLEKTLLAATQQADVVITSGGVSVGEADHMKTLLSKHGQVLFWKINMKPGRPLAYGKIGEAHYFGLPGNPVAVMVTFYQFVRVALLTLMGQTQIPPQPTFNVVCTEPIKKQSGRTEFQRGILYTDQDGSWKVKPTGNQGSAILSSMSKANCFIVLDESVGNLDAGTTVAVQVLHGLI
ncbi:MoeA Molybdopterin biosynthesis enzyme [Methylophilaceae bacterium]